MPANVAAIIISVRASTSCGPVAGPRCGTMRASSDIAFSHHRSDTR